MIKYRPTSGSEGYAFIDAHCGQCKKEKFYHTQTDGDKCCDILSRTLIHDVTDPEYPEEWTYENGVPVCTAWEPWNWQQKGDPDDPDNPNYQQPENPNQIKIKL